MTSSADEPSIKPVTYDLSINTGIDGSAEASSLEAAIAETLIIPNASAFRIVRKPGYKHLSAYLGGAPSMEGHPEISTHYIATLSYTRPYFCTDGSVHDGLICAGVTCRDGTFREIPLEKNDSIIDPETWQVVLTGDGTYLGSSVHLSFADTFPQKQFGLVIGEKGEILYPALSDYLEEINTEFAGSQKISVKITAINSRNGEFTNSSNNIRSLDANTRVLLQNGQWDGRSVDIGGHEPTTLVLLEIIPQLTEDGYQGESNFLMFRRPIFGTPQKSALYPVDGQIVEGSDGRYQIKIAYPNIQKLLIEYGMAWSSERIGPPTHPSCHASSHETRDLTAARLFMEPKSLNALKEEIGSQNYLDTRTSHLIPASEIIRNIHAKKTSSEIITGLQALALQHISECWISAAAQLAGRGQPKVPPAWAMQLVSMNSGHPPP